MSAATRTFRRVRRYVGQRPHHPWRVFSTFTEWRLEFTDHLPPGLLGMTLHDRKVVLMANGLTQAERRCTIAHETQHIRRGAVGCSRHLGEEALIDRHVARLLMPSVTRILHALAWAHADHETAAEELWVDEQTLHCRLSTLAPRERAALEEQLAEVLL